MIRRTRSIARLGVFALALLLGANPAWCDCAVASSSDAPSMPASHAASDCDTHAETPQNDTLACDTDCADHAMPTLAAAPTGITAMVVSSDSPTPDGDTVPVASRPPPIEAASSDPPARHRLPPVPAGTLVNLRVLLLI